MLRQRKRAANATQKPSMPCGNAFTSRLARLPFGIRHARHVSRRQRYSNGKAQALGVAGRQVWREEWRMKKMRQRVQVVARTIEPEGMVAPAYPPARHAATMKPRLIKPEELAFISATA